MDCQALIKHSSGSKSPNLSNATLHFISTQLFGPHYFQHLAKHPKIDDYPPIEQRLHMFLPQLSFNLNEYKKKAQDVDGHLCKSAAEFLLNPWLLIQLPWNAALLNQWLMAALAEVLKVKKELVNFPWWPLIGREVLITVNVVITQVEVLHLKLMSGIDFVGLCKKSFTEPEVSHATLTHLILPMMAPLEMLLNKTLFTTIEGLKKISWPMEGKLPVKTSNGGFVAFSGKQALIDDNRSAYGSTFWLTCDSSFPMFNYMQTDSLKAMCNFFNCIGDKSSLEFFNIYIIHESFFNEIPAHQIDYLEQIWFTHQEEIIEIVKDLSTKAIVGDFDKFSFTKNKRYLCFALLFKGYKALISFTEGYRLSETSAILNINHLQAEYNVADMAARMSGFVYAALKGEGQHVYLRTPSSAKEQVTPTSVYNDYKKSIPAAWTEETLKMKFPKECRAGINSSEACPDIETEGGEAVIKIFEVKII
jgi:hypothetical protein